MNSNTEPGRVRRSPPPFRRVTVAAVTRLNPRLVRVTFTGAELDGLIVTEPGASIRLLLPRRDASELVVPTWRGNEFLLPNGIKPAIRTFTPSLMDSTSPVLELDIVVHGHGVASEWAETVRVGDLAAVSGPGRGHAIDVNASDYIVAGDESAIPAIRQLLEALPARHPTIAYLEVASPDGCVDFAVADHVTVEWLDAATDQPPGTAMADAAIAAPTSLTTHFWVAGEAAAVQRVRKHLFTQREFPRAQTTIRGYWKHGRVSVGD